MVCPSRKGINSLPSGRIQGPVHLFEVARDEKADFSRRQAVIAHFSGICQMTDDISCGATWILRHVGDDFPLQSLQSRLFLTSNRIALFHSVICALRVYYQPVGYPEIRFTALKSHYSKVWNSHADKGHYETFSEGNAHIWRCVRGGHRSLAE